MHLRLKVLLLIALALGLSACGGLPAPIPRATGLPTIIASETPTRRPTRTPTSTETIEPSLSPTAYHPPTQTPPPAITLTPSVAPTLPFSIVTEAPTAKPITPSPTAVDALDCKLIWQSPPSGSLYYTGRKFAVGWNIKNIGTVTWDPGSFTFTYLEGARLATHDFEIPLHESVRPGQETVLSVPMKAPLSPGQYTTHWGIRQGTAYFCRLTLTIKVQ